MLKFNGRLFARSPFSNLEELEMLRLGVEGKAAGWRTLQTLADTDTRLDPGRLDELISRARRQADLLEDLRVGAAKQEAGHDSSAGSRPGHGAAMPEIGLVGLGRMGLPICEPGPGRLPRAGR